MTVTCQATCFMRKYEVVDLRSIDLSPKPDIVLNPVVNCARTHGSEGIIKTRQAREHQTLLKTTECGKATVGDGKTPYTLLEEHME